jgi:hypothetical protein
MPLVPIHRLDVQAEQQRLTDPPLFCSDFEVLHTRLRILWETRLCFQEEWVREHPLSARETIAGRPSAPGEQIRVAMSHSGFSQQRLGGSSAVICPA